MMGLVWIYAGCMCLTGEKASGEALSW